MYDLLLKGARVINPAQRIDSFLDIAITNQIIANISPNISTNESTKTLQLDGNLVTPGLIDIHSHVPLISQVVGLGRCTSLTCKRVVYEKISDMALL